MVTGFVTGVETLLDLGMIGVIFEKFCVDFSISFRGASTDGRSRISGVPKPVLDPVGFDFTGEVNSGGGAGKSLNTGGGSGGSDSSNFETGAGIPAPVEASLKLLEVVDGGRY